MSTSKDPHEREPSGPNDVDDQAPFRHEHPVDEKAVEFAGGDADLHPLEGGQTEAVDEAQEELSAPSEPDGEPSMSADSARPGGGEQVPAAD